jgi:hypothetical protein
MISTARSSIIIHELQEKGKGKGKNWIQNENTFSNEVNMLLGKSQNSLWLRFSDSKDCIRVIAEGRQLK